MTTRSTQKAPPVDIAAQIVGKMKSLGITPIPRNYQLFYLAFLGSNPDLNRDIAALGNSATQDQIDDIADRYVPCGRQAVVEGMHERIHVELEALIRLLQKERVSLQSYSRLLGETTTRFSSRQGFSLELLNGALMLLTEATRNAIAHGQSTVGGMERHTQEMQQVRDQLDEYKRIALTDSLTQVANRRAFDEKLAAIYNNRPMLPVTALVLADIDHFKNINDFYGHPVGDKVLATVATLIRSNVRKEVFVARSGGEEFALVVEGNTAEEVMNICERIRRRLEAFSFRGNRSGVDYGPVTMSLGFAMASQAGDPGDLYANADTALYHAKNAGRNRTAHFEDGMKSAYTSKGWLIYKK